MMRVLVIADDLSGAAEIAGIGARYGLKARLERGIPLSAGEGLTAIDSDTRLLPQDEAVDALRRAVQHVQGQQFDLVYKKTDSAFRGPLRAEVEALMEVLGLRRTLLVAQNPSRKRTISDGQYRIAGALLTETSFARDPAYPARTSGALGLLGPSTRHPTRCLAAGSDLFADGINIGEAADAEHVKHWAAQARAAGDALPAGGADFFQALLAEHGLSPTTPFLDTLPSAPTLFVCGTSQAFNQAVVERATRQGITVCPMPDHSVGGAHVVIEAWRTAAAHALNSAGRVLLVIQRPIDTSTGAPQRFQGALAEVVARLITGEGGGENLLLEGGATAEAVCQRLGWREFHVDGEFAAGVVQMSPILADGAVKCRIVIKPGSYLWPDAIWNSVAAA